MKITGKCVKCRKRTQGKVGKIFLCRDCRHLQDKQQRSDKLAEMDKFDFGWLAGLIEGEGCFYCKSSNSNLKSGSFCYPLPGFIIMSTDKDVMERTSSLLDLTLHGPYYKQYEKERKVVWSIQVTGYRAVVIMTAFYKHLSVRRKKQIDDALNWQSKGKFAI